jgi:septum formation protein
MIPDPEHLRELANYRMPFGKHKGMRLVDLPEPYVVWFSQRGYPEGRLGDLLREMYEIKLNGLEHLLRPITQKVILASASPRRKQLMATLGHPFEVATADQEELFYPDDPHKTATENAELKSKWCRHKYPGRISIAADTVVEFRGHSVTKPASIEEAQAMLRDFSGNTHNVLTAVTLHAPTQSTETRVVTSSVTFRTIDEELIKDYFGKVNPMDKAGAYNIDEYGQMIIEDYSGSYTNIVGLPIETVGEWLATVTG